MRLGLYGTSVRDEYTVIAPPAEDGFERSTACWRGATNQSDTSSDIPQCAGGNDFKSDHIFTGAGTGCVPKKRGLPTPPSWNRIGQATANSNGFDDTPPALRARSASDYFSGKRADAAPTRPPGFKARNTKLAPARQKG